MTDIIPVKRHFFVTIHTKKHLGAPEITTLSSFQPQDFLILLLGGACLGAMAVLCQAGLRDAGFDPWLGGVLPSAIVLTSWINSESLQSGVLLAIAGAAVIALLMLVRISYGNTTITGFAITLVVLVCYALTHTGSATMQLLRPEVMTALQPWHVWLALASLVAAFALVTRLDVVMLAEKQARLLGLPVKRVKLIIVGLVSALTVAVCALGAAVPVIGWLSVWGGRRISPSNLPLALLAAILIGAAAILTVHRLLEWVVGW